MIKDTASHSRGAFRVRALHHRPFQELEGAGKAECSPHPWPPRERSARGVDHRYGGSIPAFPARVVYGLLRALPGEPACLPPSSAQDFRLAQTWRLHGRARTTRLRRPHQCRTSCGTSASTAFRSTFVTTRTPLLPERNERKDATDLGCSQSNLFFAEHLDQPNRLDSARQNLSFGAGKFCVSKAV